MGRGEFVDDHLQSNGMTEISRLKSIDHEKPTKDWYYEDFAALVEVAKKDGKL